jgi:hypothetical protein
VFVSSITNSSAKTAAQNQVVPKDSKEWGGNVLGPLWSTHFVGLEGSVADWVSFRLLAQNRRAHSEHDGGLTCAANADGA